MFIYLVTGLWACSAVKEDPSNPSMMNGDASDGVDAVASETASLTKELEVPVSPLTAVIVENMATGGVVASLETNVKAPRNTHVVQELGFGSDYNVYPDESGLPLQGVVMGPVGELQSDGGLPLFWLTAALPLGDQNKLPILEFVLAYPIDEDDGPGDRVLTASFESKLEKQCPTVLTGIESMTVQDHESDGSFEVVAEVGYQSHCGSDEESYIERMIFSVNSDCPNGSPTPDCEPEIVRLTELENKTGAFSLTVESSEAVKGVGLVCDGKRGVRARTPHGKAHFASIPNGQCDLHLYPLSLVYTDDFSGRDITCTVDGESIVCEDN